MVFFPDMGLPLAIPCEPWVILQRNCTLAQTVFKVPFIHGLFCGTEHGGGWLSLLSKFTIGKLNEPSWSLWLVQVEAVNCSRTRIKVALLVLLVIL